MAQSARLDTSAHSDLLGKLSASQLFIQTSLPVPDSKSLHGTPSAR